MTVFPMPRPNIALRWLFAALGAGQPRVELDRTELRVRAGAVFVATIDRSAIASARRDSGLVGGIGAHGIAGHWLVNTSVRGIVRLTFDPAARGWTLGFPVRLTQLRLSLSDPGAFVAEVGKERVGGSGAVGGA